jgi:hypothetical protein
VLGRVFVPKRGEVRASWRHLHVRSFVTRTLLQIQLERSSEGGLERQNVGTHIREEKCIQGFGGRTREKETTRRT